MSKDVAEKTLLTIILSIVSITVVSLIITPMMCRIEMRKFIGLRFFLLVE
jgi:multidrug efflux pump subunit AcrB